MAGKQYKTRSLYILFYFQEQQRSKSLEDNMKRLDEERKRTDQLLYQMIPKPIADRLRKGDSPISTCEVSKHFSMADRLMNMMNLSQRTWPAGFKQSYRFLNAITCICNNDICNS